MKLGEYETNQIYLENSYVAIKKLPNKCIDTILTDPPYEIKNTKAGGHNDFSENGKKSIQGMNDELEENEITESINVEILDEFMRVMKVPNIYIWCNKSQIPMYLDYFVTQKGCSFEIIVWKKTNAMPLFSNKYLSDKEFCLYFRRGGYCNPKNYEYAKTVWELPINVKDKGLFEHPTIKPFEMTKAFIENSSNENDVIADFFLGSGTTCVAAKELNRQYIGFENNERWFKIAYNRLNKIDAKGQISMFLK